MKKLDSSLFYKYQPILSRNAVFNFIVGGRGIGKSYGAKRYVVNKFLKTGEQFILLRRYKEELGGARRTFFNDIGHEFPGIEFRVNGNEAQICRNPDVPKKEKVWEVCGHFIALSQGQHVKSTSFELVRTIIFDEFIIEKGALQYLPNEAKIMLDLYSTVDRWQDKTRVVFLANAISITNPYFLEYKINPDGSEWVMRYNGFVCCHFPDNAEFSDEVKRTRFGQFISGTEYEEFSIHNKFSDNTDSMVQDKTPRHEYKFTLETEGGIFSCWRAWSMEMGVTWHVQMKRPKNDEIYLTMIASRMTGDRYLVQFSDALLSGLRTAFRQGRCTFDTANTRNSFVHIFNRK